MDPLVEEAMKKATIAWVRPGDVPEPIAIWCLWVEGALYVVSGSDEQPAPGLADAAEAQVHARGDHGGQIVAWTARVTRVHPDTTEWTSVAPQLAGKRLNASDAADALVRSWADGCVLNRLTPVEASATAAPDLPDGGGAAPPRPTPAARRTRNPFRLHRVARTR